ncbi:hypothetical protein FQN51_007875 [Onygenales sp. PD_10]|nr:hypothetical protein FQN51_007875 [Onygenales sp. PD_10]
MAGTVTNKFTLYSFAGSQWAGVAHLTLAEKGYAKGQYDVKEIDLITAENFEPDYLAINPNGTIPSLTGPALDKPLIESADILEYLNQSHPSSGPELIPTDPIILNRMKELIDLVHSKDVNTNLILLQARDKTELVDKRGSIWKTFLANRQAKLDQYSSSLPAHPFYGPKSLENSHVNKLYNTEIGPDHEAFFDLTHDMYRRFAAGMARLESLLALPYAAGMEVTAADLHIVPWLAHAMWGAGGVEVAAFEPLEKLIGKTVLGFKVGPRTREWWVNFVKRESFKEIFPMQLAAANCWCLNYQPGSPPFGEGYAIVMENDLDSVESDWGCDANLKPSNEPDVQDEVRPQFDPDSLRLLDAVNEGDEYELQRLLDKGVDLQATNEHGETALHLAVINNQKSIVELLLKSGSDTEAADKGGSKPLYVAAEMGNPASVKLLLRYKANVESFNEQSQNSALHHTLLNHHTDVAEVLLENHANIDMPMTQNGPTLLFRAVADGNLHLAEFLLDNGANKYFCDDNGRTAEDLACEGTPMKGLLRSDRLLQGPSIERRKTKPKAHFTQPVLPGGQVDKLNACRGFEGTIIDFFVEETEQRIEKTVPVYDLLYGSGAESIMNSAKEKMESMVDRQRSFRWYHLPANNMEWVEILITRHFGERGSGSIVLSEKSKSKLALTNAMGHQYRASANLSSYMRPICQTVKALGSSLGNDQTGQTIAYRRMADFLKEEKGKKPKAALPTIMWKVNPNLMEPAPVEETVERSPSVEQITHGRRTLVSPLRNLGDKIQLSLNRVVDAFRLSLGRQEDLEKGEQVTSPQDTTDNGSTGALQASHEEIETPQHIDPNGAREPRGSTRVNELEAANSVENIQVPRIYITQPSTQNTPSGSMDLPIQELLESLPSTDPLPRRHIFPGVTAFSKNDGSPAPAAGGRTQEDSTIHSTMAEEATTRPKDYDQPPDATNIQANKPETTKPRIPSDEHLVKGYLSVTNPTASPLQLRRTLDQYFYAHLSSTAERDSGQVVYRYTEKHFSEPKIIMVDQLWLWVLNEDTIISCFPQRWDVWANQPLPSAAAAENVNVPPIEPIIFDPPQPPAAGIRVRRSPSHSHEQVSRGRIRDKTKIESSLLLEWVSGKISKPGVTKRDSHTRPQKLKQSTVVEEPRLKSPSISSSRSSSTIEKRRLESLKRDPLNVLQMILGHLRLKTRDPFTSVYDLARLIVDSCVGLFDPYHAPDEYQFFDFFERSIGAVIDQETRCFQDFAEKLDPASSDPTASLEVFSISTETKLLVEIKDIIDELGILHMILTDQRKPTEELSRIVTEHKKIKHGNTNSENSSPIRNPVLENNLHRVEKMQKLANESYKALYNLLDLKQKQNNVSEALSARVQAENTSRQARAANDLSERGLQQAKLARQQAAESIRQGRTVLVFTVVTIIFVRSLSQ